MPEPARPLRVVHCLTRYQQGGSERRLRDAVAALPGAEHHVVVGVDSDLGALARDVAARSIVVEPRLKRAPDPVSDLRALAGLRRTLRRLHPDVLHTCQSKAGLLGRLAARSTGVPRVVHSLSMANFGEGFGPGQSVVFRTAERVAGRWTDRYLVVGTDLRDRYVAAGISKAERYGVVRSGLDVDGLLAAAALTRDEARGRLGLPREARLLTYVGSLDERKRVLDLPALLAGVRRVTGEDVWLVVAGTGPLDDALGRALDARGLFDRALFLGHSSRIPELMAASDCVVLPSRAEGLPQVLAQASAVGVPWAAYEVDGTRELLGMGALGAVVAPGDLDALTAVTRTALAGPARGASIDMAAWREDVIAAAYRRHLGGADAFPLIESEVA